MRCHVCDFDPAFHDGSNNYLVKDKREGKDICIVCLEIIQETLAEFGTEDCDTEYKREHGVK